MPVNKQGRDKSNGGLDFLRKNQPNLYGLITAQKDQTQGFEEYHIGLLASLAAADPVVYRLIEKEYQRLNTTIQLIAAENQCSRPALAALGSIIQNKTTEGFPAMRFHGGCQIVDCLEELAVERAITAFDARYANVQPHSGTQANQIVMTAILEKNDRILSLAMDQGGHVSHGADLSFSGKFFHAETYCVNQRTNLIDYEAVRQKARHFKPKLIICGASAYARTIDFSKFRLIADEVGAFLLADISHLAALIMTGLHPSPINQAHFTTTSTYKPGGPRGGLIVMGKDYNSQVWAKGKKIPLYKLIEKTTFPGVQGTPYLNNIAAKAVFFNEVLSEEYKVRQQNIIKNAKTLAASLSAMGHDVLTNGTDNHMVLINVASYRKNLNGCIAQKALEDCGIIVNMNKLPYDPLPPAITSGMRLGTPIVTRNGMAAEQMEEISAMIDTVLAGVKITGDKEYKLNSTILSKIRSQVKFLAEKFPIK